MNFTVFATEQVRYKADYTLTLEEIKEVIQNARWEDDFKKAVLKEIETTNTTKYAQQIIEEAWALGILDYPTNDDAYEWDYFQIEKVTAEGRTE